MPFTILTYLLKNPFTSTAGVGLLLSNIGPIITLLGSGTPISTLVADPHFSGLIAAFGALAAKDMNTTGGTRQQ
jgi:hypothetical protein